MAPSPRTTTPTAPAGRAMLRNVGAATNVPTTFDVRTAYDFSISLFADVGLHDELPEEDRRWLERSRADLPASLQPGCEDEMCVFGASLLIDHPEAADAAGLVELLRATQGKAFASIVLADELHDPARQPQAEAAIAGDTTAIDGVLAAWPEPRPDWVEPLLRDADTVTGQLTARFEAWLPRYQEIEPRVKRIIHRDVELRAADRASLHGADLIENTTSGIRWLSEPGVRRVVLAPAYLSRPYNFTFTGRDWRMFVYPVSDAALEPHDPLAPPTSVLRLHRALGDESRLRILRLLRDRDFYITEIAEHLELSKPTIKHHLAQLRAAGLVTLTEEGGLSYYSLRRDRLDDVSSELKHYLVP